MVEYCTFYNDFLEHKKLRFSGVGQCRVDIHGNPEEGDDAGFFSRTKRLGIVFDGIGGIGGKGSRDLARLKRFLREWDSTLRGMRKILFRLFDSAEGQSVFAALYFPENIGEKALLFWAGDVSVLRVRNNVLEVLTTPNTVWEEFCKNDQTLGILNAVKCHVDVIKLRLSAKKIKNLIRYFTRHFRFKLRLLREEEKRKRLFSSPNDTYILSQLVWHAKATVTRSLKMTPRYAKTVIQNGIMIDVQDGDRYALVSDGIYPDVLDASEVGFILKDHRNPEKTAEQLVESSTARGIKEDDRTAQVIDIAED